MLKFELKPNEYVVVKSEEVHHGGPMASFSDGLVLTNQSLILISRGVFGRTKSVERFRLQDIKYIDGKAQAVATDDTLEVYFRDRQDSFRFRRKREASAWAKNIRSVIEGSSDIRQAKDKAIPGAEYVAEAMKDTIDAVRRPFRTKARRRVTTTCKGCGASMSGPARGVVKCQHCGSDQQLPKK